MYCFVVVLFEDVFFVGFVYCDVVVLIVFVVVFIDVLWVIDIGVVGLFWNFVA